MERYRIVEWLPVFIDETACQILANSFNYCINTKHLRVNAYVIMPTHLHAITFDSAFDPEQLNHTLDDTPPGWFGAGARKFTGRQLLDHAARHLPKMFTDCFRENAGKDRERRFWQPSQHPVGIYSNEFWKQKLDYVHHNPCRKGLVRNPDDWQFLFGTVLVAG